mmetsp:Transcript_101472/g.302667  ORF Transcript_101472/g.302667 Transcript_101472/m.302667 type:complete len:623 (+) Transcript_101472:2-1870(+)
MRREAKEKRSRQEQEDDDEPVPQARAAAPEPAAAAPRIRVPQHRLVHSGTIELTDYMESNQISTAKPSIPKLLKLTVEVPTVKRVGDISLEVTSMNVVVEVPNKYYLDLPLPYEVQDANGSAKFDKTKQVLTLELPVVPKPQTPNPNFSSYQGDQSAAGGDDDGALSEGRGDSDEDLPTLREEEEQNNTGQGGALPAPPAAAAAPEPAAPAAPGPAPARQLLEFGAQGGSLHIAQTVAAEEAALEEVWPDVSPEDCPPFVAAESFEGRRPGYYFGLGEQGLGYYVDKRQPRPGASRPSREVRLPGAAGGPQPARPTAPSEPLVSEVADRPAGAGAAEGTTTSAPVPAVPREAAPPARQLPPDLQRYVDATSELSSRISAAGGLKSCEEPAIEWEQTLQNLVLFIDVPRDHEVADLQLSLRGQRLSLAFCARPVSAAGTAEPAPWRRFQLRRLLCGMVDPRQWHAEPPAEPGEPLVVVVRKVDRGLWTEIFDSKASAAPEPRDSTRDGPSSAAAASQAGAGAAAAERSAPSEELDSGMARAEAAQGDEAVADAEDAPVEDSAELDAVAPGTEEAAGEAAKAAAEGRGRSGVPGRGPATEAMIQSAVVMGQGVLIRNRLIYELV